MIQPKIGVVVKLRFHFGVTLKNNIIMVESFKNIQNTSEFGLDVHMIYSIKVNKCVL